MSDKENSFHAKIFGKRLMDTDGFKPCHMYAENLDAGFKVRGSRFKFLSNVNYFGATS